jgi:hypothetical protein
VKIFVGLPRIVEQLLIVEEIFPYPTSIGWKGNFVAGNTCVVVW